MNARTRRLGQWWPVLLIPFTVSIGALIWNGLAVQQFRPAAEMRDQAVVTELASETRLARRREVLHSLIRTGVMNRRSGEEDATTSATQSSPTEQEATTSSRVAAAAAGVEPGRDEEQQAERDAFAAYSAIEQAIREQAKRASVVIEVDPKMQVGRNYTSSLIIQGGTDNEIASLAQLTSEPIAAEFDVEIAPDAEAYASSSHFDVEPITPAKQAIRAQAPTVWQWTLNPKRDGDASIMFVLLQRVRIGTESFSFPVRQFPQIVKVELTWWLWAKEIMLSFWGVVTALLVAGASAATIINSWKGAGSAPATSIQAQAKPVSETSRPTDKERTRSPKSVTGRKPA